MKETSVAARVKLKLVVSDPTIVNNIRPVKILENKWANNPHKGPGIVCKEITNQVGGKKNFSNHKVTT